MFVNWAYFVVPKVAVLLSLAVNAVFFQLVRHNNTVVHGPYRSLLYVSAALNSVVATMNVLVPLAIQNVHYAAVIFVPDGLCSYGGGLSTAVMFMRVWAFFIHYGMHTFHYVYRHFVITHAGKVDSVFSQHGVFLSFYVSIGQAAVAMFGLLFFWQILDVANVYLDEPWVEMFGGNAENSTLLASVFEDFPGATTYHVLKSWITIGILILIIVGYTIAYSYFGISTLMTLNRGLTTLSHRTTQLHERLMKMVMLMAMLPVAIDVQFLTLVYVAAIFGLEVPSFLFITSSALLSMSPCLSPLTVILYIPAFRRVLASYLRKTKVHTMPVISLVDGRAQVSAL